MAIEIRACRPEEMDAYYAISRYVFASTTLVDPTVATTAPEWTTCGFEDGKLVATMGTFPFTMRLNGAAVRTGGVTQVGTLPSHRRQGFLRKIMRKGFEEMRERDQPLAILWASMGAIYQRFGYGLAAPSVHYQFDPRYAGFQDEGVDVAGTVSIETPEEAYPTIKQLYIETATPRNLWIHRSRALWQADTLREQDKTRPTHVAVYRNPDGEPRGYIVYNVGQKERPEPGPNHVMTVNDFVWRDLDAYRGLWEFIRKHDLVGEVNMVVPDDDPAPDLLLEPRMLRKRVSDGIWMRVTDIEKALAARPYGERGELVIELPSDDMCPWNVGRWQIETDGQTPFVTRTDRAADLTVSPNGLATLLAGCRTATHLARAGRISGRDAETLLRADRMFRTEYYPHGPNNF